MTCLESQARRSGWPKLLPPDERMPIPLNHFHQSADGRCLPACVRMLFDRLGYPLDEDQVARILGSYSYSSPCNTG